MAKYEAITKDKEVEKIEDVKILETTTQSVNKTYTLSKIDDIINSVNDQIRILDMELNRHKKKRQELQDKRKEILKEAEKIKLK
jgi:SLT domain-containing protein